MTCFNLNCKRASSLGSLLLSRNIPTPTWTSSSWIAMCVLPLAGQSQNMTSSLVALKYLTITLYSGHSIFVRKNYIRANCKPPEFKPRSTYKHSSKTGLFGSPVIIHVLILKYLKIRCTSFLKSRQPSLCRQIFCFLCTSSIDCIGGGNQTYKLLYLIFNYKQKGQLQVCQIV